MPIGKDLLTEVRKASNAIRPTLTDYDLYTSPEFAEYAQNLTDVITGRYKLRVGIHCEYGDVNGSVAATDGKDIVWNTNNGLKEYYSTMLSRFLCQMGILFHETAHIGFLDFDAEKKAMKVIESGMLFGEEPPVSSQEETEALAELLDAIKKREYFPIFEDVYHNLSNIISDAHDEDKLCDKFGGYVTQGITFAREALQSTAPSVETLSDESQGWKPLEIMFNLSLQFARYGEVVMEDYDTAMQNEYVQKLFKVAQSLDLARYTDNTEVKFSQMNKIVFVLWPFIKDALENADKSQCGGNGDENGDSGNGSSGNTPQNPSQQGGSQNSSSSSGGSQPSPNLGQPQQGQNTTPSPQAVQSVLNQLGKAAQSSGQTTAPQNRVSSSTAKAAAKTAQKQNGTPPQPSQGSQATSQVSSGNESDNLQAALDGILQAMSSRMAEDKMEQDLTSTLLAQVQQVDMNSTHKGRKVHVTRTLPVSEADKRLYATTMKELLPVSRRLQKQMKDALRDMKEGAIIHHRPFGNIIEANQAYRVDQMYFANKKQPLDLPDMAVSLLIDHSGSMSGMRLGSAMKAAMLLHDFALGLNIPIAVSGHKTTTNGIRYYIYSDYDTVGKKDKYRLAQMHSGSFNRDGMAIEIAANLLSRRPEDVKLLIIISDGQPNDDGYGGDSAAKDIRSIVQKYKRKGVQTFAAAIGDDKEKVKGIYKDGYLDISDLSKLPKILVSLVKKRIV